MDTSKAVRKTKLDSLHIKKLVTLLRQLEKLNQTERLNYMKSITKSEIKLISEIIHNLLNFNTKTDFKSLSILKRVKNYLYKLSSKRSSYLLKKKILKSLKGLNILNIIIPLALNTLTG